MHSYNYVLVEKIFSIAQNWGFLVLVNDLSCYDLRKFALMFLGLFSFF